MGYIDVAALRALKNSPLAGLLGLTSPGPEADQEYEEFVRQTGFDYTRDLDKAAIAFWPHSFAVEPGNGIGENRVLAIADGRFDQQKIKAYALRTGKILPSTNPPVYEVPGNPTDLFPVSLAHANRNRQRNQRAPIAGRILEPIATRPGNQGAFESGSRRSHFRSCAHRQPAAKFLCEFRQRATAREIGAQCSGPVARGKTCRKRHRCRSRCRMRLGEKRLRDFDAARRLPDGRLDGALRSKSASANDQGTSRVRAGPHPTVEYFAPRPLGASPPRASPRRCWASIPPLPLLIDRSRASLPVMH